MGKEPDMGGDTRFNGGKMENALPRATRKDLIPVIKQKEKEYRN